MIADLFESAKWSGEFFFPDWYESRFQGELSYSPESGLILSYLLSDAEKFRESQVIHGILNTGDPCTLFGTLPFPCGSTLRNGIGSHNGVAGFPLMAVGGFLSAEETITEIDFTLTNLQEFFFPTGFKSAVKFSSDALYSVRVPFGLLEVGHSAQFTMLPREIERVIYSHEPDALKKLSEAFGRVSADHPRAFFSLKKDIEYRLIAKFEQPRRLREAFREVLNISNLFSILLHTPVYPESVRFYKTINGQTATLNVFPSLVVDPRTIQLIKSPRSHFHMPITQGTIPLDKVVETWFIDPQRYSVVVSALQGETGFRNEHTTYGDLLLYATRLESISFTEGHVDTKYEYPLQAHAHSRLKRCLLNAFNVSDLKDAGVAISDLRNEIAHVRRPRKWLKALDLSSLMRIARCVQLVTLDHILKDLGVPEAIRERYQDEFCPPC